MELGTQREWVKSAFSRAWLQLPNGVIVGLFPFSSSSPSSLFYFLSVNLLLLLELKGFGGGLSFMFNLGFSRAYVVSKKGLPFKHNKVFFTTVDLVYCDLRENIFYFVHH